MYVKVRSTHFDGQDGVGRMSALSRDRRRCLDMYRGNFRHDFVVDRHGSKLDVGQWSSAKLDTPNWLRGEGGTKAAISVLRDVGRPWQFLVLEDTADSKLHASD